MLYDTLLLAAFILILVDIFLSNELPTHIAYVILTTVFTIYLHQSIIHSIFLGVLIWLVLVVFHYTIWRKLLERFHDKILAPRKHVGGIEGLIGEEGMIITLEGNQFIQINEDLYQFESQYGNVVLEGHKYKVVEVKSNKLFI